MYLGSNRLRLSLFGEWWGVKAAASVLGTVPAFWNTPPFQDAWQVGGEVALSRAFGPFTFAGSVDADTTRVQGTTGVSWRIFEPLSVSLEARWPQAAATAVHLRLGDWVASLNGAASFVSKAGVPRYQTGAAIRFDPRPVPLPEAEPAPLPEPAPVTKLVLSDEELEGQVPSQLVQIMQKYPHLKLRIEMYVASGSGNPQRLSEANAQAIYKYLQRQGIEKERLEILPMGESPTGNRVILRIAR
jgi:hypothetical protein